jgi:cell division protein FtsB
MSESSSARSTNPLWWGLGVLAAGLVVWVAFFDSHSLWQRYRWHQELEAIQYENAKLQQDIERLQTQLDRPLSDSLVEHIARQQYGMKRPGETIYRIAPD